MLNNNHLLHLRNFITYFNCRSKLTNKGICFREITSCKNNEDCTDGFKLQGQNNITSYCCLDHCCPAEYYQAWREWPCHSDFSCKQLGTGSHCCNENGAIISNDINIKDYPKEKTRCCFQDKVRQV